MALSPNYGWSEPDNSSLVKNGAADIRTLGDAIDSSLWAVGFGQAGKNAIINGDFGIWQRGTSFAVGGGSYTCDRFSAYQDASGATKTISRQAFTAGTELGSTALYFFRYAVTVAGTGGSNQNNVSTKIENVQTFAGQTMTVSFYAKADATRSVTPRVTQNFGSGGSSSVAQSGSAITLTTSWARYSATFTMAALTGKTIGTSSYVELEFLLPGTGTFTIDLWGVQAEYGLKATPFETATGTIVGESQACLRYFWKSDSFSTAVYGVGACADATNHYGFGYFPVTMRVSPTATATAASTFYVTAPGVANVVSTSIALSTIKSNSYRIYSATASNAAFAQGRSIVIENNANSAIEWSAEL